jgi:hypothetical protein
VDSSAPPASSLETRERHNDENAHTSDDQDGFFQMKSVMKTGHAPEWHASWCRRYRVSSGSCTRYRCPSRTLHSRADSQSLVCGSGNALGVRMEARQVAVFLAVDE